MGQKLRFKVEGMMCEGCVSTLRKALSRETDVSDIVISLERHELELTVQGPSVTPTRILQIVEDAGYSAAQRP